MADDLFSDDIATAWEEEGLFARDLAGQLIRLEKATEQEYSQLIEIEIDGQKIAVPKSAPSTDAQGNLVLDEQGRTVPRRTTIYDAAYRLFGDSLKRDQIIPTLCHVDHLRPVGVCRVCSVEVSRREKDAKDPTKTREVSGEKLLPACVQPVEPGMVVHTRRSPVNERARKRVETSIRVLVDLLAADHLPSPNTVDSDFAHLARRLDEESPSPARFERRTPTIRERDDSSHFIAVDHTACILCDRCSRACNEIKHNHVIGRSGKGYSAQIAFDLNDPMGFSSCVECGECMLSCPTTALTFRQPSEESEWYADELRQPGRSPVPLDELTQIALLQGVPRRWLEWNSSSIVKWDVKEGETVCRIGEYGSTAFVVASGRYEVLIPKKGVETGEVSSSWWQRLFGRSGAATSSLDLVSVAEMTSRDVIFGEMSCLSSYPRNATIRAVEAGTLYVIRRNVLHNLQRNPTARQILNRVYLERAVNDQLRRIDLFDELSHADREACRELLRREAKLVTLDPGQPVFRQGERPDAFYMVRIGHVKVAETFAGQERILTYLPPNRLFGETAFVLDLPELANDPSVPDELRGRRTASASALDDVELVRVSSETFRYLLDHFPAIRQKALDKARQVLGSYKKSTGGTSHAMLDNFTKQGLYNAQRLLVIDLENCTRCDECTKACSDTHGGVARLIRDGERFDKFLVASSCRSCTDPYCLVGCPVDSIHRDGERLEIRIESHCIGCGLCASNCPYGNINMVADRTTYVKEAGRKIAEVRHRATTCDLCSSVVRPGQEVSCVYACPHHAAFRMSGPELFSIISAERR